MSSNERDRVRQSQMVGGRQGVTDASEVVMSTWCLHEERVKGSVP